MNYLLGAAARNGDLSALAQYSAQSWQPYRKEAVHCLLHACDNGHLAVAQFIHNLFKFTRKEAKSDSNFAFRWACASGHLLIAQWLHATFEITRDELKMKSTHAFYGACRNNKLAIIQWLYRTFHLTADDVHTLNNYPFRVAYACGHTHIIQWLCITYKFPLPTNYAKWGRRTHVQWYWQPHAQAVASHMSLVLLTDVLHRM